MKLSNLIDIGTENKEFSSAHKIKLTNIVSLFTFVVSSLYTLSYLFILDHTMVAGINAIFSIAYLLTLLLNRFDDAHAAKTWFFCILMLHLIVCTNIYVTKASGFHLYFFLVPTGAFLLFELKERSTKVILSLLAVIGFFYCENTINNSPLIILSAEVNHILYQSVIFINMIEVIFVLTLFANQIESNEVKLNHQAKTDSLTNIANRHYFFEQGKKEIFHANQYNRPYSLVLLDLDHFKNINDQFGHYAGDICLIEITKTVSNIIRKQDFFARIGGEEFVIAMPDTTLQEANNLIERLRLAIAEHVVEIKKNNIKFSCSASFGIAGLSATAQDLKAILSDADKALYKAKKMGRNRIQLFSVSA